MLWTRSYITSAIAGLADQQDVLTRLLKNQQDIGDAIKPLYGDAASNKLAELLREHILLAGKVVDAEKSGNQADLVTNNKEWHRNADDMAKFLSAANPNWSQKTQQEMLYTHLQFLTDQATARLKKDWKADILAFDKGVRITWLSMPTCFRMGFSSSSQISLNKFQTQADTGGIRCQLICV